MTLKHKAIEAIERVLLIPGWQVSLVVSPLQNMRTDWVRNSWARAWIRVVVLCLTDQFLNFPLSCGNEAGRRKDGCSVLLCFWIW